MTYLPPIDEFRLNLKVSIMTMAPKNAESNDTVMSKTTQEMSFFEVSLDLF